MSDEQGTSMEQFSIGSGRARPPYTPRRIKCPKCEGPVSLYSEQSQLVVCDFCQSQLDLSAEELRVLGKVSKSTNMTLDLGAEFTWEDVKYKIIGRLVFVDGWGDNSIDYLLFHPLKGSRWLSEYDGSYSLGEVSHVMPVENPFSCSKGNTLETHDGQKWRCLESGTMKVTYVDGALPWLARIGDAHKYVEFVNKRDRTKVFEAQQSQTQSSEMEFGISRSLNRGQVRKALGQNQHLSIANETSNSSDNSSLRRVVKTLALLSALFHFYCIISASSELVTRLEFASFQLNQETLSPSFDVTSIEKPVEFICRSSVDNAWMALDLAVVEIKGSASNYEAYEEVLQQEEAFSEDLRSQVVFVTSTDISYYHGYEGGESWSEGSQEQSVLVKFPKTGTYRLMAHAVSGTGSTAEQANHSVSIQVDQNVEMLRYYLIMIVLSAIVFFVAHQAEDD